MSKFGSDSSSSSTASTLEVADCVLLLLVFGTLVITVIVLRWVAGTLTPVTPARCLA